MELKEMKFASTDFISNMPDNLVTDILDRLPLQDVVGTSILARNWRYKWTMLSQLVCDLNFFRYLKQCGCEKNIWKIVSRLLLNLKGVITKFVLQIEPTSLVLDDEDIAHWILFLSGKGVLKDLSIHNLLGDPIKLPSSLFSCLDLRHLELVRCCFDIPVGFRGFPNLLSLSLWCVDFESRRFGDFFTNCPVLEILNMGYFYSASKVKLAEIAKLGNLKSLRLHLCNLETSVITSSACIFELLGFLPKLQELHVDFLTESLTSNSFTEDGARKRSSTTFPSLKTLELSNIDLGSGIMLPFVFEIIGRSPNLQTLKIAAVFNRGLDPPPAVSFPEVDYNTMGLLQLRKVEFHSCKASDEELRLIKYLLACSPFLKVVFIYSHSSTRPKDNLIFTKKLLNLPRASPLAVIDFF